jgi:CDP-diacylglycerol pyrophosphatase
MKLKGRSNENLEVHASLIQPHAEDTLQATHQITTRFRHRAYEIYQERGVLPGHELEDRLQAESELERATLFVRTATGEKHRPRHFMLE